MKKCGGQTECIMGNSKIVNMVKNLVISEHLPLRTFNMEGGCSC